MPVRLAAPWLVVAGLELALSLLIPDTALWNDQLPLGARLSLVAYNMMGAGWRHLGSQTELSMCSGRYSKQFGIMPGRLFQAGRPISPINSSSSNYQNLSSRGGDDSLFRACLS